MERAVAGAARNLWMSHVLNEERITMTPPTGAADAPSHHPIRTTTIWHLAHRSDWIAAVAIGSYRVSTRGASLDDVGFIHDSRPHQLAAVAECVFADAGTDEALCILVMEENTIRTSGVEVCDEDGGDGELYPHVYGPIDPDWVIEVRAAAFDPAGRFVAGDPHDQALRADIDRCVRAVRGQGQAPSR